MQLSVTQNNQKSKSSGFKSCSSISCTRVVPSPKESDNTPQYSYYKRELPKICTGFTSPEGRQMFRQALNDVYMESYFELSQHFLTQSEPAFCGLSSLCMVLNALGVDPLRQWKGVWRWYDESMLDCCRPLDQVIVNGITLPEFSCLARCNGLESSYKTADQTTKEDFLIDLMNSCKSPGEVMVVSYCRKTLGQTGDGHFSPVGGESLFPIDSETQKPRGYSILKKKEEKKEAKPLSHLSVDTFSWKALKAVIFQDLPKEIGKLSPEATINDLISTIIKTIPEKYDTVVENRVFLMIPKDGGIPCASSRIQTDSDEAIKSYLKSLDQLLIDLSKSKLYDYIKNNNDLRIRRLLIENHHLLDIQESAVTMSPQIGRISKADRKMSRQFSRSDTRSSFADLVPLPDADIDDFVAFTTLFFYTLLTYSELFSDLGNDRILNELNNLSKEPLTPLIQQEVFLLKKQIEILNDEYS
ncbi:hypothetical protein HK103_003225 [Boothiomyces macroporosus]|uniref:glutathione gamma-glutamylcysteinyltransferase n=1 Tax=Boothiomyces macroporosus TaxID=261099 RepID=A0AAD5UIQ2_9FUNG|nr:hypothetical protein HK103_003225 [Boothiomyces macroporosus]